MSEKTEKKSFLEKFRHKYRLSIYRDETFRGGSEPELTRLNVQWPSWASEFFVFLHW